MSTSTVQRIEATISRFGKIQQSQYPPHAQVQSVLFVWMHQGRPQEVWKTYPAEQAQGLKVGQRAFLSSRTGRNNQVVWDVEVEGATPAPTASIPLAPVTPVTPVTPMSQPQPAAPSLHQDIAAWVEVQAQLYSHCFDTAWLTLAAREVSEETVRAAASTLFINACRKFNLDR